jgi:molybdopterin synthase catalytic subunit
MAFTISVQEADFDVGAEYQKLVMQDTSAGAVVFFVGRVRDMNLAQSVSGMYLEHYPGMTEKVLQDILQHAQSRWPLIAACVIHRVGQLNASDQIVFVGVTSAHRNAAFQAAEFLMDFLKNQAPFWKKETYDSKESHWVKPKESDIQTESRWTLK